MIRFDIETLRYDQMKPAGLLLLDRIQIEALTNALISPVEKFS